MSTASSSSSKAPPQPFFPREEVDVELDAAGNVTLWLRLFGCEAGWLGLVAFPDFALGDYSVSSELWRLDHEGFRRLVVNRIRELVPLAPVEAEAQAEESEP